MQPFEGFVPPGPRPNPDLHLVLLIYTITVPFLYVGAINSEVFGLLTYIIGLMQELGASSTLDGGTSES